MLDNIIHFPSGRRKYINKMFDRALLAVDADQHLYKYMQKISRWHYNQNNRFLTHHDAGFEGDVLRKGNGDGRGVLRRNETRKLRAFVALGDLACVWDDAIHYHQARVGTRRVSKFAKDLLHVLIGPIMRDIPQKKDVGLLDWVRFEKVMRCRRN